MPDRPSDLAHVESVPLHIFHHVRLGDGFSGIRHYATRKENAASFDGKRVPGMRSDNAGRNDRAAMNRKLVWIEQERFRGFGCSECAWVFKSSGAPVGKSFDEMMRNFELQRDREFTLHVCTDHSSGKSTRSKNTE
jgi:hypothetical protein